MADLYIVGMWLCHIPTLHQYDRFPPGIWLVGICLVTISHHRHIIIITIALLSSWFMTKIYCISTPTMTYPHMIIIINVIAIEVIMTIMIIITICLFCKPQPWWNSCLSPGLNWSPGYSVALALVKLKPSSSAAAFFNSWTPTLPPLQVSLALVLRPRV